MIVGALASILGLFHTTMPMTVVTVGIYIVVSVPTTLVIFAVVLLFLYLMR